MFGDHLCPDHAGPADFAQNETEVLSNLAPVEQRKKIIYEGKIDENITSLVDSLIKEGVLRG